MAIGIWEEMSDQTKIKNKKKIICITTKTNKLYGHLKTSDEKVNLI